MGSGTLCITVRCSGRSMNAAYTSRGRNNGATCERLPVTRTDLWKLPEPWTPRTRPPLLGKPTERVFHSSHRPSSARSGYVLSLTPIRCKQCCRTSVNDQPVRSGHLPGHRFEIFPDGV